MDDEPTEMAGMGDEDLVRDIRRAFQSPPVAGPPLETAEEMEPPENDASRARQGTGASGGFSPSGTRIDRRVGDFDIVREVGRGGMGVVYLAEQASLGRRVALKVLRPHPGLVPADVERFRREASAAAKLRHPSIVSIHAVGEDDGIHFLAMDFIEGESLADLIERRRRIGSEAARSLLASLRPSSTAVPGRDPCAAARDGSGAIYRRPRSEAATAASIGLRIAEALAHAHAHGIIHRDVKPSNILLDREAHPYLSDFGLAREDGAPALSRTGDVIGTPAYMSPEQASGSRRRVDHRTDVYSLGATLYELLALEAPFRGDSTQDVLRQVVSRDPAALRKIDSRVPRDLETIVHVALEKEPTRRYESAEAMAADLRRFLELRPILARPVGLASRVLRHARRRPAVAAALLFGFLAVVVGPIVFGVQERLARQAIVAERDFKANALARLWAVQSEAALRGSAYQEAAILAAKSLVEKPTPTARGVLFRALAERPGAPAWTARLESDVLSIAVGADGERLAVACANGQIQLLSQASGEGRGQRITHTDRICCVAISPDGRLAAFGARDEKVRLEPLSGDGPKWLHSTQGDVLAISFTPDGSKVAFSGSKNKTTRFLDVASGKLLPCATPPGFQRQRVFSIAFSPDGLRLASASLDKTVCLFDLTPGVPSAHVWRSEHGDEAKCVAFAPDGARVASGSADGTVRLWDAPSGEEKRRIDAGTPVVSTIAFSPSGSLLAWGGDDRAIYLWDTKREKLHARLDGHEGGITSIAFGPDGRRVFSASHDRTVRAWTLDGPRYGGRLVGHKDRVLTVAFRPAVRAGAAPVLASAGGDDTFFGDNSVRLWDLEARRELTPPYSPLRREVSAVAFHPGGALLAAGYSDGELKLWDASGGEATTTLRTGGTCVDAVAYSRDGAWLAAGGRAGTVTLWDARSKAVIFERSDKQGPTRSESGERIRVVQFGLSSALLAAAGEKGEVLLFEVPSGKERGRIALGSSIFSLAFDPRRERLAAGRGDGVLALLDLPSGRAFAQVEVPGSSVIAVAFLKGGSWLAAATSGGALRVWDAGTLEEIASMSGLARAARCLSFSPDGAYFAFGAEDNSVGFRDIRLLGEIVASPGGVLLERAMREMGLNDSPPQGRVSESRGGEQR